MAPWLSDRVSCYQRACCRGLTTPASCQDDVPGFMHFLDLPLVVNPAAVCRQQADTYPREVSCRQDQGFMLRSLAQVATAGFAVFSLAAFLLVAGEVLAAVLIFGLVRQAALTGGGGGGDGKATHKSALFGRHADGGSNGSSSGSSSSSSSSSINGGAGSDYGYGGFYGTAAAEATAAVVARRMAALAAAENQRNSYDDESEGVDDKLL